MDRAQVLPIWRLYVFAQVPTLLRCLFGRLTFLRALGELLVAFRYVDHLAFRFGLLSMLVGPVGPVLPMLRVMQRFVRYQAHRSPPATKPRRGRCQLLNIAQPHARISWPRAVAACAFDRVARYGAAPPIRPHPWLFPWGATKCPFSLDPLLAER